MTQYSGKVIRKTPVTPTQQSASGVWTLTDQAAAIRNNNWPVPGVPDPISRSSRFRSSASAYYNRTFGTPTDNLKWTWSGWIKLGLFPASGYGRCIFGGGAADSGNNTTGVFMNTSNQLYLNAYSGGSSQANPITTAVFRDPSAWYHLVCVYDSANATQADRFIFYVNGVRQAVTGTLLSLNLASKNNASGVLNRIGMEDFGTSYGFDGYMTEINFVDGQALTPSSFGTTDPLSGAWEPMPYTGTYGANGFYLNFKDNTSTTTLGYDYSGNSNNWTANNISLTAGVTYDSMLDVPTPWVGYNTGDTSAVTRGNYAVLNPIVGGLTPTISYANLRVVGTSVNYSPINSSIPIPTTGKWYMEATITAIGNGAAFGITVATDPLNANRYPGQTSTSWGYLYDGNKYTNGSGSSYGASLTTNNVVGIAFDADAGTLVFYKDNASQGTAFSSLTSGPYLFVVAPAGNGSGTIDANFGQRPFAYTPPSGYKALCTTNLSTPTIANGANYMAATLYTGTGSAFTLTGVGFQPDFGWFKGRNASSNNWLHDVVRGANPGLSSNSTAAEDTTAGQLTAFASDGYSLPNDSAGYLNYSGRTMVVWSWKAGGTGSSNTSGSITSTVSVNQTAGFSIVSYTGTLAAATIGHGLGAVPAMIITKNVAQAGYNWRVYHVSTGATNYMSLNLTNASAAASSVWNNTTPTSTVFSVAADGGSNNTDTMVAYCWAAVAGYSAFGSYTGNGSSDGPFVYLGFRPRWILFKRTDVANDWFIYDTSRNTYNAMFSYLLPDTSGAEAGTAGSNDIDVLSNGFKIRNSNNYDNASGGTIIYAAFAENPFKYSNAR